MSKGIIRKNLLMSRMVYNPLGKNLLFPSWLTGDGKENSSKSRMIHDPLGKNLMFPSWLTRDDKEKLGKE